MTYVAISFSRALISWQRQLSLTQDIEIQITVPETNLVFHGEPSTGMPSLEKCIFKQVIFWNNS